MTSKDCSQYSKNVSKSLCVIMRVTHPQHKYILVLSNLAIFVSSCTVHGRKTTKLLPSRSKSKY